MSYLRRRAGRVAILVLPIALGACAQYGAMNASPAIGPRMIAWDGAGEDPNLPQPTRKRSNVASQLAERSSHEQPQDGAEDADRELAAKLVICSGCIKSEPTTSDGSRVASR
jgi:hypothetical protein